LIFAILILDPYPVHDVYSWDVTDPLYNLPLHFPDDFKAGTNPLNDTVNGYGDFISSWNDSFDRVVTTEVQFHNGSWSSDSNNDTWITVTAYPHDLFFWPVEPREELSPWVDIGSIKLFPWNYEVWVLRPAARDGRVNYKVFSEDNTTIKVVEPDKVVTREYGDETLYLDCTFTIDESGTYRMEADRAALSRSFYMAVIPEGSWAYPFTLAIGWLLILQVVTVKGYDLVKRWSDRTKNKGRHVERYVFLPDVAYFFAMGPEPAWKGGAFFMFPRGTSDFLAWEPMSLEFPKGTDRFFDRDRNPD
jgi:hypothetical protein